jgi:NAD(P)-dependent dehydrogenase (short-subunit alcohol dehydrogenase family)
MAYPRVSKAVLITGCSTGIGRATARRLARAGFDVFATARRPETLEELKGLGCRTLALDVTDEESMVHAVRPFGIAVSLIEPGAIKTVFDEAALARLRANTREGSPYETYNEGVAKGVSAAYEGVMGAMAGSPNDVAKVIERTIRARRPRSRYRVGVGATLMLATRKLLPDRAMDLVFRSQFASPTADSN